MLDIAQPKEKDASLSRTPSFDAGDVCSPGAKRDEQGLTLADLVARAGDLAALPQVVIQVIDSTNNPRASAADIERVVGKDQALTARILTLANSSYYGLPRRVSSLREAVFFLGFKTVRNLAMTVTSFNLFLGKSDAASLARRDLWKHALNAGLCGKLIASAVPNTGISEEVFTAALLHDIGKMILDRQYPERFTLAVAAARERNVAFHHVEQEFLPFTHAEVGAALAERWNLPAMLLEAIGYHHMPEQATSDPKTCAVVTLASDLANAFGTAPAPGEAPAEHTADDVPALTEEAVAILDLKADALYRLSAACAAEVRAGSALCTLM